MANQNIVQGDTYPFTHSTSVYRPDDGWTMDATLTDSTGLVIPAETTQTLYANCVWSGLFLPASTATLAVGSAGFTIRFKRDFTPPGPSQDTRTDVAGLVLQVVSPSGMNADQAYNIEQLRQTRMCIAARLKSGVSEYEVADYRMSYLDIDKLIKLEKYYAQKVADANSDYSTSGVTQVIFQNNA